MEAAITGRPTRACVDLGVLDANVRTITAFLERGARARGLPTPGIIGVVKANAYGHGAAPVALALEAAGARMLACADVEEGVELREAGVRVPILVFGALSLGELEGVFSHDLTPSISTPGAAAALEAAAARHRRRLRCQLKVDTGMHRLGFRDDNLERTIPGVLASPHLAIEAVFTHFATADTVADGLFDEQVVRFEAARRQLAALGLGPVSSHAANSAAVLRGPAAWYDAVRPGLLLYGVVAAPLDVALPVEPVMSFRSRVVAIRGIRAGEGVNYGMRFRADSPRSIAVVPAGYADGLDPRLANRATALVRGQRAPIVGAVCMDMITLDVTGLEAALGDEVVLIGRQGGVTNTVREVAATIGALPYELVCRVGTRVERVYP